MKITPKIIQASLDYSLIASDGMFSFFYLHSNVRGYYFIANEDMGYTKNYEKSKFLSGNMNEACNMSNDICNKGFYETGDKRGLVNVWKKVGEYEPHLPDNVYDNRKNPKRQREQILIGNTVTGIQLTEEKDSIRFLTEEGTDISADVLGDCCSTSWIEAIESPAKGFPAKVLSVENLFYEDQTEDAEIKNYGLHIKTTSGDMLIEYRNESNGYYGGSLDFYEGAYYKDYYKEENDMFKDEWKDYRSLLGGG